MSGESDLKELARQKEQEWKNIQDLRLQSLENNLKEKESELQDERKKFNQLKDDFKYNFKLLRDRNSELEAYDAVLAEMKTTLSDRDAEISELKIRIDDLNKALEREAVQTQDLQKHYQSRLRERNSQLEEYRVQKDAEFQLERENLETFKRNLERQVNDLQDELDTQRQELTLGFEESMKKREHEHTKAIDELNTLVLAHELKVKLLSRELESLKDSQKVSISENRDVVSSCRQLEKQLKHKEWELQDAVAMKDARITEVEGKLFHAEQAQKKVHEDFQRKHAELDRYVREKDAMVTRLRDSAQEKENEMHEKQRELQAALQDQELKVQQLEWAHQDINREKDIMEENYKEEIHELKKKLTFQLSETSQDTVIKDVELRRLKEMESKYKIELEQRKQDIDRYKRDLAESIQRESELSRAKEQVELDWQRRMEDVEHQQYERSEDLVKSLSSAKDKAMADMKIKDKEITHQNNMISVLMKERDMAYATLKQHGMKPDTQIDLSVLEDIPRSAVEQIKELQGQNENLRTVIRQMRQEMEDLGGEIKPISDQLESTNTQDTVTQEYVKNLESELHKFKSKVRKLEEGLDDKNGTEIKLPPSAGENSIIRNHVQTLNNTIGTLRSEKVELLAQTRKYQSKVEYLEGLTDRMTTQPNQQQVEIEKLQYDLAAAERRSGTQLTAAKHRIAELEEQLLETRKEADEFYKANLERNMEVTNLQNQLSALKLDLAEKRQPISYGASELLIQQLQDEIKTLKSNQPISQDDSSNEITGLGNFQGTSFSGLPSERAALAQMQLKLRQAAKHISLLAKEKQQLIEVGNRLRAELKKNGLTPPSSSRQLAQIPESELFPDTTTRTALSRKVKSKLEQLEALQYQFTKMELGRSQTPIAVDPTNTQVPTQAKTDIQMPSSILKQPIPKPHQAEEEPTKIDAKENVAERSQRLSSLYRSLSPRTSQQFLTSMSSLGGESLQEIWKMLEQEDLSPRPLTANSEQLQFTNHPLDEKSRK